MRQYRRSAHLSPDQWREAELRRILKSTQAHLAAGNARVGCLDHRLAQALSRVEGVEVSMDQKLRMGAVASVYCF